MGTTSVECVADSFSLSRCMDLIEVGNRLCQPSLVAHVESVVVDTLSVAADGCKDLTDVVFGLLEPAQVAARDCLLEIVYSGLGILFWFFWFGF